MLLPWRRKILLGSLQFSLYFKRWSDKKIFLLFNLLFFKWNAICSVFHFKISLNVFSSKTNFERTSPVCFKTTRIWLQNDSDGLSVSSIISTESWLYRSSADKMFVGLKTTASSTSSIWAKISSSTSRSGLFSNKQFVVRSIRRLFPAPPIVFGTGIRLDCHHQIFVQKMPVSDYCVDEIRVFEYHP